MEDTNSSMFLMCYITLHWRSIPSTEITLPDYAVKRIVRWLCVGEWMKTFFCIKQWHLASEEPVQQSDRTRISQHMNGALYLVPQLSLIYWGPSTRATKSGRQSTDKTVTDGPEVTDGLVVRAGVSVTWNVVSWSGGHEFEPQSGRTWGAWYFCPKWYLNQIYIYCNRSTFIVTSVHFV